MSNDAEHLAQTMSSLLYREGVASNIESNGEILERIQENPTAAPFEDVKISAHITSHIMLSEIRILLSLILEELRKK